MTISGMLYRMKKNAASLSNICIFSTMVVITVVCTVALYLGMDSIVRANFTDQSIWALSPLFWSRSSTQQGLIFPPEPGSQTGLDL